MKEIKQRRHTVLIYCEGKTDHLFVKYLKSLFSVRGLKMVTLKKGAGGGLSTFVSDIIRNAQVCDHDEKYIVLDADGRTEGELEKDQFECKKKDIELIWQKPCLEGLFLKILKGSQLVGKSSQYCKSIFYKNYANNKNLLTENLLNQLFAKNTLNTKRHEIRELNQLIQLIEELKTK